MSDPVTSQQLALSALKNGLASLSGGLGSEGTGLLATYGLIFELGRMIEKANDGDQAKLAENASRFRATLVKFREQFGAGQRAAEGVKQIAGAYLELLDDFVKNAG